MVTVRYGGKNGYTVGLDVSDSLLAVRTHERRRSVATADPVQSAPLSERARAVLRNFDLTWELKPAGIEVLRAAVPAPDAALRDEARLVLKDEAAVRFAGRVLQDPDSGAPVLYTENFFVKFEDDEDPSRCEDILANYNLTIKRRVHYTRNAYFAEAPEGTGLKVFEIAEALLAEPEVQLCHPELIRERRARGAFPQQWHLAATTIGGQTVDAHANVVNAWALTRGEGVTIAIIDSGIDIDHEEFRSAGKIVAPLDATSKDDDPRPVFSDEEHGTACAGVACADGNFGASGVAPRARLIPIRLQSDLGSQDEADAFEWAARNGADVISCSWGPMDGDFTNPNDPRHHHVVPLPDSTRTAIEFAVTQGRNGKGCVVLFAAGNGNESVDNDGYASYPKVIAVAACNDVGKKSPYSDFGRAVWSSFPSNNYFASKTDGIWTTDVSGKPGYNPGAPHAEGDAGGNYTSTFGGTSSACPGMAGVAALVISRNPDLRWDEVKDVLRRASEKIDAANGQYDAQGHSQFFGFGRINARKAVEAAVSVLSGNRVVRRIQPNTAIQDFQTTTAILDVPDAAPILAIKATVDIEHTYVGDLNLTLQPPAGVAAAPILLHVREGGSANNLKKTYDAVSTPALQNMVGKSIAGQWTLTVTDEAAQDQGVLREFALDISF
jgi:subtilisin family serine protease